MGTSFTGTLPPFPHYTHDNLFLGNRLAPIPDFNKENDDPMWPTSPPYDPEQVIRDREARRPLLTLSAPPAPTSASTTLVGDDPANPIIVDLPFPQPLAVSSEEEDWHNGAHASEAI